MPTGLARVIEARTYELEADPEADAIERVDAEPEDLPIGSLVAVERGRAMIRRAEEDPLEGRGLDDEVHPAADPTLPV